ncbi:hypothetical protein PWT90_09861 [Aphanocladium album]|nr:hypothetical protein PWT90_09861 [Aphanocladium album]
MKKRKGAQADASSSKKLKSPPSKLPLQRDLLELFYPHCATLRKYILDSLPQTSRLRRRKIESLGTDAGRCDLEKDLCRLLDSTLVCYHQLTPDTADNRWEQWLSFSQKGEDSTVSLTGNSSIYSQSEIIDFVIWLLFSRDNSGVIGPKHLLCDGYRRSANENAGPEMIPGVFSRFPNDQVASLKASPWPQLLALLGQSGEKIMINMLVDCSIFVAIEFGLNNFYQISGHPISELEYGAEKKKSPKDPLPPRKISEITLVRSRIFYARPPMTSRGHIQPGYRHIHILNRCPFTPENTGEKTITPLKNDVNTAKVLMYIFPRQFGLHNVFTSTVDTRTTVQKFQDYTVRDEEIARILRSDKKFLEHGAPHIPKRLRGTARNLVRRLQIRHRRCSYFELIRHYCPSILDNLREKNQQSKVPTSTSKGNLSQAVNAQSSSTTRATQTQNRRQGSRVFQIDPSVAIVDLATPVAHVSAFLQAVLSKVVPDAFWGEGDDLTHNKTLLSKKVHHFVTLRRFETMNLHEISQGFKTSNMEWPQLPGQSGQKPSQQETKKQLELFHEFLYYIFDSLLIPLARNTFYITESNSHRYQVFYFRHDVWRLVSERAMGAIKDGMLEELKVGDVQRAADSRRLGFSQIRLLPKGATLRPIMNLRRRYPAKHNKKILGPSINSVLTPIYNVLKLEKHLNLSNLGATLFSVGDIYKRLKNFRSHLPQPLPRLYFVKADVQSAFDTIPQDAVLKLMTAIPSQASYKIFKHAEVKAGERSLTGASSTAAEPANNGAVAGPTAQQPRPPPPKPIRRWNWTAYPHGETSPLLQRLQDDGGSGAAARQRKNTVFVNSAAQSHHTTRGLLHLLAEHVTQNHIKVGKKVYRQRRGIPQGSVLSSYLCNYFYADLESKHLSFLKDDAGSSSSSVLLRLIDDFLLITTDKSKALRFAEVLHRGVPEYGVQVNPKKSLANFRLSVPGQGGERVEVASVDSGADFPYCGIRINCSTLAIKKDCERDQKIAVSNTLTVEHGRAPGQNFERKVLPLCHKKKSPGPDLLCSLIPCARVSRVTPSITRVPCYAYTPPLPTFFSRLLLTSDISTGRRLQDTVTPHVLRYEPQRPLYGAGDAAGCVSADGPQDVGIYAVSRPYIPAATPFGQALAYESFEEVLRTKQTQHAELLAWLREQAAKYSSRSV